MALILAACSKDPGKAGYQPRDGSFALTAPADWRVAEDQGEAQRVIPHDLAEDTDGSGDAEEDGVEV